jgi:hypothetical protein
MLLFLSFLCFAVLFVSWLALPDNQEMVTPKPAEKTAPETSTMPARA